MARQLLQDRTPAGYAGVEAFARRHAREDAGALAWLVLGYARILDGNFTAAIDALSLAKAHAGDLGDYVNYHLANSYLQTGRTAEAIGILSDFNKNYPDSLLVRDADALYASALLTNNRAAEAAAMLEKDRSPVRSEIELALGRAYAAAGQPAKAAPIFKNIYYTLPLSAEAGLANVELQKLGSSGTKLPAPTIAERKTRADLLAKGRQYSAAADEFRGLLSDASSSEQPAIQLALGVSLRRADRDREARKVLDPLQNLTPEQNAERLYNLAWIARGDDDEDRVVKLVDQIRSTAAAGTWMEQALLMAGNMYLLKPDYDRAIDFYRELHQRFPNGRLAGYTHWKVAWLSLRTRRIEEAKKEFEQQITLFPRSNEVVPALYWRARLAEDDGDHAMARAFYQKVSDRFRNYYYGELARRRLAQLKPVADPPHYAILDHLPPIRGGAKVVAEKPPEDNLRVQKARLLENGALIDLALKELEAASDEEKGNWLTAETARIYQDAGRYDMAVRALKRAVPNYFSLDLPVLPRQYWEALFPRPYWQDLKRHSTSVALDPYLVASLIRQESEFNPNAVSNKNAVGLMQVLPDTGKKLAKQEKIKHFSANQLFTPDVNMQLGTRYFRAMVDKFGGFEYALAAYNAGPNRVEDWLGLGKYRDPQEFVESIPFTETREYVQAILRNESVYRQLYGTP